MDTEFIDETGATDEGRICHEIFDADGTLVTSHESTIHFSDSVQVDKQVLTVIEPKLWDIKEPNLYQIRTSLYAGDTLTDSITQNLGFRDIAFDADKGFFLKWPSRKDQWYL